MVSVFYPAKQNKLISILNFPGSDSEDNNSDPINIRTSGPRTPRPCQYNFLVCLGKFLSSNTLQNFRTNFILFIPQQIQQ